MRRSAALFCLAVACLVAWMLLSPGQVDVVTGATKPKPAPKPKAPAPPPAPAPAPASRNPAVTQPQPPAAEYFVKVTQKDTTAAIQVLTADAAEKLLAEMKTAYAETSKTWLAQKQEWTKATGSSDGFPLPAPQAPKCESLGKVPPDQQTLDAKLQLLKQRLDVWDVCRFTDCEGKQEIVALRDDQVHGKWCQLSQAYYDAVLAAKARAKDDPTAPAHKISRPTAKIVKDMIPTEAAANQFIEAHRAELTAQKPPEPGPAPAAKAP